MSNYDNTAATAANHTLSAESHAIEPTSKEERWVDIPEYTGIYQVSDTGKVRSVDREITATNPITGYETCSGLIEPDTLMRDNYRQLLGCYYERETNQQAISYRV